jgi:hypothetical protein
MPTTQPIFSGTIEQSTVASVYKSTLQSTTDWVSVVLCVQAISGTSASAAFRLQWSLDGGTWAEAVPADAFDPITTPTCVVQRFATKAPYFRAVCDLTGTTPSFTGSANCYS